MRYTITFTEDTYHRLTSHLFKSGLEEVACLLCTISKTDNELRFIVKEVHPIPSEELRVQKWDRVVVSVDSYGPIIKRASDNNLHFVYVHSHPNGLKNFSELDDTEEYHLFKSAYNRLITTPHASMVFSDKHNMSARVWLEDENKEIMNHPINLVRIVGKQFKAINPYNSKSEKPIPYDTFFDRQVKAFGKDLQTLLKNFNIGVIGSGGTGSAIIEQLTRLGVGKLTIVDYDKIEATNVTRIHGSTIEDVGKLKVDVMEKMTNKIGLETKIKVIPSKVTIEDTAKELRDCDLLFGCTDDNAGRIVLNLLSLNYYIPLIDLGVNIDSIEGTVRSIPGRISIVKPQNACLICQGIINFKTANSELLSDLEKKKRVKQGYASELNVGDPAVIAYTTGIASLAIDELLHLLTGYKGEYHNPTQIKFLFDRNHITTKHDGSIDKNCSCNKHRGQGDTSLFLGLSWYGQKGI